MLSRPNLAKAHYFYGLTLKTQGLYDEAIESFRRAAASYPRDRVVRNQIGRVHFLKREFPQAVAELSKTLEMDPEDLEAHYNLMLAYQGWETRRRRTLHRTLYLRFKADEARSSSPATIGVSIPPTTTRDSPSTSTGTPTEARDRFPPRIPRPRRPNG